MDSPITTSLNCWYYYYSIFLKKTSFISLLRILFLHFVSIYSLVIDEGCILYLVTNIHQRYRASFDMGSPLPQILRNVNWNGAHLDSSSNLNFRNEFRRGCYLRGGFRLRGRGAGSQEILHIDHHCDVLHLRRLGNDSPHSTGPRVWTNGVHIRAGHLRQEMLHQCVQLDVFGELESENRREELQFGHTYN